jgi:hypothetical protein
MFDPVLIVGFIALFVTIGGFFLAVNLLVGRLVRPRLPNTEKLEVYECGEPTIGSSFSVLGNRGRTSRPTKRFTARKKPPMVTNNAIKPTINTGSNIDAFQEPYLLAN